MGDIFDGENIWDVITESISVAEIDISFNEYVPLTFVELR